VVNGLHPVEPTGIEPATSWLQTSESPVTSVDNKALAPMVSPVCTRVCTSEPENANADSSQPGLGQVGATDQNQRTEGDAGVRDHTNQGDPLAKLAAVLLTLSPADRARLAKMLASQ
jgi:hypothetical protein